MSERCKDRYPVPKREEPFKVTYRCGRVLGHEGEHGPCEPAEPMPSTHREEPSTTSGLCGCDGPTRIDPTCKFHGSNPAPTSREEPAANMPKIKSASCSIGECARCPRDFGNWVCECRCHAAKAEEPAASPAVPLKRYWIMFRSGLTHTSSETELRQSADGPWVSYDDVEKLIAGLTQAQETLTQEVEHLNERIQIEQDARHEAQGARQTWAKRAIASEAKVETLTQEHARLTALLRPLPHVVELPDKHPLRIRAEVAEAACETLRTRGEALVSEWRERARRIRPLESAPITAAKRAAIAEWMWYTNRANELKAALASGPHPSKATEIKPGVFVADESASIFASRPRPETPKEPTQ